MQHLQHRFSRLVAAVDDAIVAFLVRAADQGWEACHPGALGGGVVVPRLVLEVVGLEIGKEGAGIIVLLMPTDPEQLNHEISGVTSPMMDLRSYGIGAQILADLGVHEMVLITNTHRNVVAIDGYGLNIVDQRAIPEG